MAERATKGKSITDTWSEEQKAAIAKAIFDNDYADMNRLKAAGKWITPARRSAPENEGSGKVSGKEGGAE